MSESEQIDRAFLEMSEMLTRPVNGLGLEQDVVDQFSEFHIYATQHSFTADSVVVVGTLVGIKKMQRRPKLVI